MSATLKILSLVAMSMIAIVVIAVAIGMWTLQVWAEPLLPTLYFATALFALFIVMGAAWFVVTRRELAEGMGAEGASAEERGLQRLVAITATVILGVLALVAVGSWNLEGVRANFVAGRATHIQLEQVLTDKSPIVQLRACEELFQRGWVFRSQKALVAALDVQPAMAVKCLQTARENDWKGVEAMASSLNEGWTASIMRTEDSKRACELAPWSPVMSELAQQPPAPRLLHCALGALSDEVRVCCANNLVAQGKLLDRLGDVDTFPAEAVDKVFVPMMSHAFQPLSLEAGEQRVAQTLATDDEAVRQWVVDLGCGVLDPTEAQPEVLAGLISLVEADTCGLTPAEESEYTAPAPLVRLCAQMEDIDQSKPVQTRACEAVRAARVENTVVLAQIQFHHAVRSPFVQAEAEFVDEGLLAYARGGGQKTKEQKQKAFLDRNAVDEFGLRTYGESPYCEREVYDRNAPEGSKIRKVTVNCDRYRSDLTIREYFEQNPTAEMGLKSGKELLKEVKNGTAVRKRLKARVARAKAAR